MSSTRTILAAAAVTVFQASLAMGQSKPGEPAPQKAESFETVNSQWKDVMRAFHDEYRLAFAVAKKKGDAAAKAFRFDKQLPATEFAPRFLAVAERDPQGPKAIEALRMTLETSFGHKEPGLTETRGKAVKILRDYYDEADCTALLFDVIARNPDRNVQAAAYKIMIEARSELVSFAEQMKNPKFRSIEEDYKGKAQVAEMIARGERARAELDGLNTTFREKYPEFYNDLSIGKPAPELVSHDLGGNEVRLSALKGKVVVLDIWSTYCGPCKEMIPHEREMVGRLKGKPFELVSISVDETKKVLTDFLAIVSMPWTHWWESQDGHVFDGWVGGLPTIYVLDTQGVIRYRDLRGEELEKAVNTLLDEASKTGAPKANVTTPTNAR